MGIYISNSQYSYPETVISKDIVKFINKEFLEEVFISSRYTMSHHFNFINTAEFFSW